MNDVYRDNDSTGKNLIIAIDTKEIEARKRKRQSFSAFRIEYIPGNKIETPDYTYRERVENHRLLYGRFISNVQSIYGSCLECIE